MVDSKHKSTEEENIIRLVIQRFFPFWPLFIALVAIFLTGAWVYLRYATPIYEASATLLIRDENKGVDDSRLMESMNAFDSKKIVENEIEVIQSRDLMRQVVDDLYMYAPISEKGDLKSVSAYTTSPIRIQLQHPEDIAMSSKPNPKVFFSFDERTNIVSIEKKAYPTGKWVKSPYGIIKFLLNEEKVGCADNSLYFNFVNPKIVTESLLESLEVNSINKLATVVGLSFQDPVPQRGEDVLNHLIFKYNQKAVEERNDMASHTMDFLEDRIKNVESELDELELKIQQYRSSQGVIDLSEQSRIYLQEVGNNNREISDIELQLTVLDNIEKYVISKGNTNGIVPSTVGINDKVLSQLLEKLYNSEIEYEKLRKTTAQNNPILVSIANEIENIRPSILENVQNQRANLESTLRSFNSTNSAYSSTLKTIPKKERMLLEISRRKAIKNDLFSFLLQKREETAMSYVPTNGDSKIIEKAEASLKPVSPKRILVYFGAIVLAFGLGAAYVLGKEMLNSKVLFRSEIEKYTHLPVIAELGRAKGKTDSLLIKPAEMAMMEQFRQLGAKLGLYRRSFKKKKILITSSIAGEGKSFVSINLAYSLAQSGKRVILMDLDFRKPNTSEFFQLGDMPGILDYLKGTVKYQEIMNPARENENLCVVPTGKNAGDYTEILLNGKLEVLFDYLSDGFDYIIMDSAPIDFVSDVNLLAEFSDITLMMLRHDYTPKQILKRIEDSSTLGAFEDVSIVFNGIKNRGFVKESFGYEYGYDFKKS